MATQELVAQNENPHADDLGGVKPGEQLRDDLNFPRGEEVFFDLCGAERR